MVLRNSVLTFVAMCVMLSCVSQHTAIVSLGQKTSLQKYIIPVPAEHELLYFEGVKGENTVLIVNKDSSGMYISNYWGFPNVNKLDTFYDRPALALNHDSMFFSGVDKSGNWRHIETNKMCIGYFGIHKAEVSFYDSLLTEFRFK